MLALCGLFAVQSIQAGQLLMDFRNGYSAEYEDVGVTLNEESAVYEASPGGGIANVPSPPYFVVPEAPVICNVSGGFTGVSIYYGYGSSVAAALQAWSGPNGTGTLLASVAMPRNVTTAYNVWNQVSITHAAAQSFVIAGNATYMLVDDIRLTGSFAPHEVAYPVATAVTGSTATLNCTLSPCGDATTVFFEYATDYDFTSIQSTAPQNIGAGTAGVVVTQGVSGLTRGTSYYFRAVATNSTGTTRTIINFLTTPETTASTLAATGASGSGAVLNGSVNPNGLATTAYFQYATNAFFSGATSTAGQSIGSGSTAVPVSAPLTGLSPGIYYFRVVATNSAGTVYGTTAAVSLNPGYLIDTAATGTYVNISTTGTQVIAGGVDDTVSSARNIGFTFPFFGTPYTSLYASSNGLVTFGQGEDEFDNMDFATTALVPNLDALAVLWDDWRTAGGVWTQTNGTAGQRVFIVQWNLSPLDSSTTVTVQMQLFEETSDILFIYQDSTTDVAAPYNGATNGGSATVGIRKAGAPGNGRFLMHSHDTPGITSGTKIRFSVPRPTITNVAAVQDASNPRNVTLRAEVNPNGSPATARFEYGLTTSYGSTADITLSPADGGAPQAVSSRLTGLPANTLYHYRVTATNSAGTTVSADGTFSTAIIAQQAYVKASNPGADDRFGRSVAIDGDTMVIGAYGEASSATTVNGSQTSNSAAEAGAAYVFVRSGGTWVQQAYLKASNAGAGDFFGGAVAISGNTIVVGARREDSSNVTASNNSAVEAGAAYVFVRSGTTWTQQALLKARNTNASSDVTAGDEFGYWVDVDGDTVAVGARYEDGTASNSGAAYVFTRTGSTWAIQQRIKASNAGADDEFGAVALEGDTLAVGAPMEDGRATNAGAAYVFTRSGGVWTQQAILRATVAQAGAEDAFGEVVVISGDTIAVRAALEDGSANGVGGTVNNSALDAGAVYVFTGSGATWSTPVYLKASNSGVGDEFGRGLALDGDVLVVGAPFEDSNATGVNGTQSNESAAESGAAYVFTRTGGVWTQAAYLKASNTGADDSFGYVGGAAVSGGQAVIGAYKEDSNASGVNGTQSNNSTVEAGAAYVFSVPAPDLQVLDDGGGVVARGGGLEFPPVAVGLGTSSRTVVLTNAGSLPLKGVALGISGSAAANFSWNAGAVPVVLNPAETAPITVTFSTSLLGLQTAQLSLASNDPEERSFGMGLTGTGIMTLEAWRKQNFGSPANSGAGANDNDHDQDGLANLLEWACALDPTRHSSMPAQGARNGASFEFIYTRHLAAMNAGMGFAVEWSDTLTSGAWSAAGVTETIISDNGTVQQVKATVPAGSSGRRFVHLKVTVP